jgi:phosphoribosylanthranilate isomerase
VPANDGCDQALDGHLKRPRPVRVKICGITSLTEAKLAARFGAAAVGLVSRMPSGEGAIPERQIAKLAAALPPFVTPVLLTADVDSHRIVRQVLKCSVRTIQLVDTVPTSCYKAIREDLPGVRIIQSIHMTDAEQVAEAGRRDPYVDAILLDSGDPKGVIRTLGGTGRTHNWSLSRRVTELANRPVILAGGLSPDNVASAIQAVRPFAVDVYSGVHSAGRLG